MTRKTRSNLTAAAVLAVLFASFAALLAWGSVVLDVTTATSPDGRYTAVVRQRRMVHLDRNFHVVLIDNGTGAETVVFKSQDQSPGITSEALVWSADSRTFALVGDDYYVVPGSTLPDGRILFLTYDLPTGVLACNTEYPEPLPKAPPAAATARFGAALTVAPAGTVD